MKINEIKYNKTTYKDLEKIGYEEFNIIGHFILFNRKEGQEDFPYEVQLYAPQAPWSLRKLIDREKTYSIKQKIWNKNRAIFRSNNQPAEIIYYKNGRISDIKWFNEKGLPHREDGKPAIVRFSEDNLVENCFWLYDGQDLTDKIIEFTNEKKWNHLRLNEEEINAIKEEFFTESNYF